MLYVASTVDNAVFALFDAGNTKHDGGKGVLIYADNAHLHGPLGLALGPNGDLFTANGDAINADSKQPSEIVEFTTQGRFVAQLSVDPAQGGAFGLAFSQSRGDFVHFAAVDDNVLISPFGGFPLTTRTADHRAHRRKQLPRIEWFVAIRRSASHTVCGASAETTKTGRYGRLSEMRGNLVVASTETTLRRRR